MFPWNTNKILTLVVWFLAITLTVYVCSIWVVVDVPEHIVWVDALIFGALFVLLLLPLRFSVKFLQESDLPEQFVRVGVVALCVVFIGLMSLETITLYLMFGRDVSMEFLPVLPSKIVTTSLLIVVVIQRTFKDGRVAYVSDINDDSVEISNNSRNDNESQLREQQDLIEYVTVKSGQKITVVGIADIQAITADGDYVLIHTPLEKYIKEQTMKYFTDVLPASKFVRVHRSSIVNVDHISRIESYEKQKQLIILRNGQRVKASVAGYRELKNVLNL